MSYFPSIPHTVGSVPADMAAELIAAVESGNPATKVSTPGYGRTMTTLADLLADELAGDNFLCHGLLAMWAAGLKSSDLALRLQCMTLLNEWQQRHVAFHLDDALHQCGVREEPGYYPRTL